MEELRIDNKKIICTDCGKVVNKDEIAGDLGVCLECYEKALENW